MKASSVQQPSRSKHPTKALITPVAVIVKRDDQASSVFHTKTLDELGQVFLVVLEAYCKGSGRIHQQEVLPILMSAVLVIQKYIEITEGAFHSPKTRQEPLDDDAEDHNRCPSIENDTGQLKSRMINA
ncbi:hypothetical protein FOZ62_027837 [Perkinsus olseni]|uniref:Uncharacterized protein n=1 Tax=Perkinsus olseni TaxID=32597 RepID=A0A7J6QMD6_PEROL|nr:hypothetical protein FOZ62_027837 [Perkinsus olseni]